MFIKHNYTDINEIAILKLIHNFVKTQIGKKLQE